MVRHHEAQCEIIAFSEAASAKELYYTAVRQARHLIDILLLLPVLSIYDRKYLGNSLRTVNVFNAVYFGMATCG